MLSNIKGYVFSESFFLDALLASCLYLCIFYYIPRLIKSIIRGEIDSNAGLFKLRGNPFAYIFIFFGNIILFLVTAMGAYSILYSKYNLF